MGRMGIEEITVQALLPLAIRGIVVSPFVSTMIQLVSVAQSLMYSTWRKPFQGKNRAAQTLPGQN